MRNIPRRALLLLLPAALILSGLLLPSCRKTVRSGVVVTAPESFDFSDTPTPPDSGDPSGPTDPTSPADPTSPSEPTPTVTPDPPVEGNGWCDHARTELLSDLAPTCTVEGYRNRRKCKDCGEILTTTGEILAACGHVYEGRRCRYCQKNEPTLMLEGTFEGSEVNWRLYDDGELAVSGRGVIPDQPDKENSYFFRYNKFVTSIVIYNGVTAIGNNVFRDLKDVKEINVASSVVKIGNHSFEGWSLATLNLSGNLVMVGRNNFTNNQLFFLELPAKLRKVGAGSFTSAQMVTIRIPCSVTDFDVEEGQFGNLSYVTFTGTEEQFSLLSLARHLQTDGACAMVTVRCRYVGKASDLPYCVKRGQVSGDFVYAVYTDNTARITGYRGSASEVTVPEKIGRYTVVSIGNAAFKEGTVIKKMTLPATCTGIYKEAFLKGTLEELTILAPTMRVDASAFEDCKSFKTLNFEGVFTDVGARAFANTKVKDLPLSSDVKAVRKSAFAHSAVKDFDFSHIGTVSDSAFGYCSLGDIDLRGVRTIGYGAFYHAGVTSLDVTGVEKIERAAFISNGGLKESAVKGLDTVKTVENGAFDF